ncbi:hypothetical protein RI054_33g128500 [Pseudoscourfieldia marina]
MGPKRTSDASASTQGEANPSDDVGDVSTTLAAQLVPLESSSEEAQNLDDYVGGQYSRLESGVCLMATLDAATKVDSALRSTIANGGGVPATVVSSLIDTIETHLNRLTSLPSQGTYAFALETCITTIETAVTSYRMAAAANSGTPKKTQQPPKKKVRYEALTGGNPKNPNKCTDFKKGSCTREKCMFSHS